MKNKLKIVLLVDDINIQNWMYLALEKVLTNASSEIVLVVRNNSVGVHKSRIQRFVNNLHKLIYFIYAHLESFTHSLVRGGGGARKMMPLLDLVPNVPIVNVDPIMSKFTDKLDSETIKVIESYDPDVIVRFGFRILKGDILDISRFGVFSYHHGDPFNFRGGPACYWESAFKINKTGSMLQILSSDLDGGKILCLSHTATNIYSPFLNYETALISSIPFLDNTLTSIYNKGSIAHIENELPYCDRMLYLAPSNLYALKHIILFNIRIFARLFEKIFWYDQWSILYSSINETNLRKFKIFSPIVKDRFWADPFLFNYKGGQYIFFEEQVGSSPAHISVGEVVGDKLTNIHPVLVEGYHLSYPFVFEHDGSIYMIPESSSNKSVDLYVCDLFPTNWVKVRTLLNGLVAADSTVFFRDGYWWLFAAVSEHDGACPHSSLNLYYSSDLLNGKFVQHPENPICRDVSKSRPAGKLFYEGGNLYRPSQDCSTRYGYAVNLNRVQILTVSSYEETTIRRIEPNWSDRCLGVHTYNSDGSHVVLDVLIKKFRFF
jgi:hypothetical protein